MSTKLLTSKEDLEKIIRKALIEVYVLKERGYPLDYAMTASKTSEGRDQFLADLQTPMKLAFFFSGEEGQPAELSYDEDYVLQEDVQDVVEEEKAELEHLDTTPVAEVLEPDTNRKEVEKGVSESPADELEVEGEDATTDLVQVEAMSVSKIVEETLATSSPSDAWRDVSIADMAIKFAVSSLPLPTFFFSFLYPSYLLDSLPFSLTKSLLRSSNASPSSPVDASPTTPSPTSRPAKTSSVY